VRGRADTIKLDAARATSREAMPDTAQGQWLRGSRFLQRLSLLAQGELLDFTC